MIGPRPALPGGALSYKGFFAPDCALNKRRCSLMVRRLKRDLGWMDFSDQIERLLLMIVLIVFGATLANGLLAALTWRDAALGVLLVFVVRPVSAAISLIGSPHPWISRSVTASRCSQSAVQSGAW